MRVPRTYTGLAAVRISVAEVLTGNLVNRPKGIVMTKQELLQENQSLRDLLLQIRDRIDNELEELEETSEEGEDDL